MCFCPGTLRGPEARDCIFLGYNLGNVHNKRSIFLGFLEIPKYLPTYALSPCSSPLEF